jgi:hypothetical protein
MIDVNILNQAIAELNVDRKATLAEFIYKLFNGKFIEVYLGDSFEEVSTEQISTSYPAVFAGKVIGAYRECLVIEGSYIDRHVRAEKHGMQVFINERAIRGLTEVDGVGILEDVFVRSRESREIKKRGTK